MGEGRLGEQRKVRFEKKDEEIGECGEEYEWGKVVDVGEEMKTWFEEDEKKAKWVKNTNGRRASLGIGEQRRRGRSAVAKVN